MAAGGNGRPPRQVALVTGAAQGLGRVTALRLAAEGFAVAVNDIAADDRLTGLATETGGLAMPADISAADAAPAMVRAKFTKRGSSIPAR